MPEQSRTAMPPYTPDELIRLIEAAGESANIDAKGPMEWDGAEASAGLTKDILAFANCRDGGVIVIDKKGKISYSHNTPRMAIAGIRMDGELFEHI